MTSNNTYLNLLEPEALVSLFLQHPPKDFQTSQSNDTPLFFTHFDILTTLEPALLKRLKKLPFFSFLRRFFQFSTCFLGTTITEYSPLARSHSPEEIIAELLDSHAKNHSLSIIKDLPVGSLLLDEEEQTHAEKIIDEATHKGFISVEGQALAYVPIDFTSTEQYLSHLSSSRRKDLRRKMKSKKFIRIEEVPFGDKRFSEQALLDIMYSMYLEVFLQSEIHFDLLTPSFFKALLQTKRIEGVVLFYHDIRHQTQEKNSSAEYMEKQVEESLCCNLKEQPSLAAKDKANDLKQNMAGYNICLIHEGKLIDKFIGLTYPLSRELNIYFISWIMNLEYALKHKLSMYIAGWTDPEVKASLGAKFTFTRHLVWVRNPLLRRVLYSLRHLFESDAKTFDKLDAKVTEKNDR